MSLPPLWFVRVVTKAYEVFLYFFSFLSNGPLGRYPATTTFKIVKLKGSKDLPFYPNKDERRTVFGRVRRVHLHNKFCIAIDHY